MSNRKQNIKQSSILQLVLGLVIIVMLNIIGSYVFTRIDLTAEKRYSLSDATRDMLANLDDIVYFQIYLEGDFPAGFKRLRNATREMLDEFRAYSDNIEYEFINPSESDNAAERNAAYQILVDRGLNPTDLQVNAADGMKKQIIFPGAIAMYKDSESPVELLRSQLGMPPETVLNNSIQSLEFNLANAIKALCTVVKPKVAFIEGHGELGRIERADITYTLQEYYNVHEITIDGNINSLTEREESDSLGTVVRKKYTAIIIAKPDSAFNEKDKFIIDQYIMYGGKVFWLVDPVYASMDSLQFVEATMGVTNNLNLDDMLFNYGVRLNTNLIMDLNALPIPLTTGSIAGQPQIDFFPWYYFPLVNPSTSHPIVNNLNAIKTEFVSSLDTIQVGNVRKSILLSSSDYSRTVNVPVYINLNILDQEPDERLYQGPGQPIAVLLEGVFESNFVNRIPSVLQYDKSIKFKEVSRPTKMIIVSDGDVIRNQLHYKDGYPLPLGFDQYTRQTFGNKEFILNAMNYLTEGEGLISIRSRELKLRLLDMTRVNNSKLYWQLLNVLVPILAVILFGVAQAIIRKRKYSKS